MGVDYDRATASRRTREQSIDLASNLDAVNRPSLTPFLKWAGGKRWIASKLRQEIGAIEGAYFEPFLGSGAVFFSLRPSTAFLSDSNAELIGAYRGIQQYWRAVERHLIEHQHLHSEEHYYKVRAMTGGGCAEKAARFIYLNRTCWNGLYRVNKNGIFNVPIGTKSTVLLESDNFRELANSLQSIELVQSDFENQIDRAERNDVVFCDPPYTVRHNYNGFVKYNEDLFSWEDQIRLRDAVSRARARGVRAYVTNAAHSSVRDLYRGYRVRELKRFSSIGGAQAVRGSYAELLIEG